MKIKSLIETNPYLQDAAMREKLVARSVRTSCGVEGINLKQDTKLPEINHRKEKKIYKHIKQIAPKAS